MTYPAPSARRAVRLSTCVLACLTAVGSTAPPQPSVPTTGPAVTDVSIDNFAFSPREVTVEVGATVRWTNKDDVPHTATATDKPREFDSKTLDTDDRYSHAFARPGTYTYFCAVHPHMTGKVIVLAPKPNEGK